MGPFALYSAAACGPADRVAAGQFFELSQPLDVAGALLFRRSLWLPLAGAARTADVLSLAAGAALALRFEPLELRVTVGDDAWFPEHVRADDSVKLRLALPVPIVEVEGHGVGSVKLFRRDGDAVSEEATTSGPINGRLAAALVGTSLLIDHAGVRVDAFESVLARADLGVGVGVGVGIQKRPREAGAASATRAIAGGIAVDTSRRVVYGVVTALRLAGRPTSPRLRLLRPAAGGAPEEMLWLDMAPGEHDAAVTLPAVPGVAAAWAPMLERLVVTPAPAAPPPEWPPPPPPDLLLRLDLESDAPCRIVVQTASLALQAESELLPTPQTLRFSGTRLDTTPVALKPASGPPLPWQRVQVTGTLVGDGGAPGASTAGLPGDGRTGVLLDADQRIVRMVELGGPTRLAGVSLPWHPLSDVATWVVQWHADGGGTPTARALGEARIAAETPRPGWIALRWPPLDLQAGRYWLRLGVAEGAGVWLTEPAAVPANGWIESTLAPPLPNAPLGAMPSTELLALASTGATPPLIAFRFDDTDLTVSLLSAEPPAPPGVRAEATGGVTVPTDAPVLHVSSAQALSLKLESVRVTQLV